MGSVVYIQAGAFQVADQPYLLIIDGQQRLTTFMLFIEALAAEQERRGIELPGDFAPKKLRHYHLKDTFQDGERAYKLLLSATDRVTLKALIDDGPLPDDHSLRLRHNHDLFRSWMRDCRKIGGQAAIAIGGHGSLAGWNFCPKPEPSVPL